MQTHMFWALSLEADFARLRVRSWVNREYYDGRQADRSGQMNGENLGNFLGKDTKCERTALPYMVMGV